jgi:hypothetical protein
MIMISLLTPDEDAVLGEILGIDKRIHQEISVEWINEISKRCNMTPKRIGNALASLHDKGAIYIPIPGEANIKKLNFTCYRCRKEWIEIVGSDVRTLNCPFCMKNDGKLSPILEKRR